MCGHVAHVCRSCPGAINSLSLFAASASVSTWPDTPTPGHIQSTSNPQSSSAEICEGNQIKISLIYQPLGNRESTWVPPGGANWQAIRISVLPTWL